MGPAEVFGAGGGTEVVGGLGWLGGGLICWIGEVVYFKEYREVCWVCGSGFGGGIDGGSEGWVGQR
jgi:TM2 domain-containing membrane protein YozV